MSNTREFTFRESAIGDGFRLDTAAGIAYGVAVCGPVSANGRDYPDAVRDRDKGVYESAPVYIDHADGERRVREWFGELRNPRTRISDRRTIADHHYPKNSAFTAEYEERAKKFPRSLGFSHVAVCQTKRVNGREVIEAIRRVESVDLVARPATNSGIAESFRHPRSQMTFKAFAAQMDPRWATRKPLLLRFLREEVGDQTIAAPPPDASPDEVIQTVTQAMHALVDQFGVGELDGPGLLAKVRELLTSAGIATDLPADTPAASESIRRTGRSERPRSGEQNRSPRQTTTGSIPTDGKAFAESLKRPK